MKKVKLVRTKMSGEVVEQWEYPPVAVWEALSSPDNGVIWKSARIEWGDVLDNWPHAYAPEILYGGIAIRAKGYG